MNKNNDFFKFLDEMQTSNNYLKMQDLKDGFCYKIYGRQAYVGAWINEDKSFLISRYKVGAIPYIFYEFHWDTGEPYGTAKPIELIEKFPFEIKEKYEKEEELKICGYLDKLENNNPIIKGMTTATDRKSSSIQFEKRLSGKLKR